MYQTYLVEMDGNWIAVVSARSAGIALRKAIEAFPELGGEGNFRIRRVRPGQVHALPVEI